MASSCWYVIAQECQYQRWHCTISHLPILHPHTRRHQTHSYIGPRSIACKNRHKKCLSHSTSTPRWQTTTRHVLPRTGLRWRYTTLRPTLRPEDIQCLSGCFAIDSEATWGIPPTSLSRWLYHLGSARWTSMPDQLQHYPWHLQTIGHPLAIDKCEGPCTLLDYLGFLLDTVHLTVSLPKEKLDRLLLLISTWRQRKTCTKHDLDSLIGQLQHTSAVVKPGRSFLRHMIILSKSRQSPSHPIRLNRASDPT